MPNRMVFESNSTVLFAMEKYINRNMEGREIIITNNHGSTTLLNCNAIESVTEHNGRLTIRTKSGDSIITEENALSFYARLNGLTKEQMYDNIKEYIKK